MPSLPQPIGLVQMSADVSYTRTAIANCIPWQTAPGLCNGDGRRADSEPAISLTLTPWPRRSKQRTFASRRDGEIDGRHNEILLRTASRATRSHRTGRILTGSTWSVSGAMSLAFERVSIQTRQRSKNGDRRSLRVHSLSRHLLYHSRTLSARSMRFN
jgi:hypothetical protein